VSIDDWMQKSDKQRALHLNKCFRLTTSNKESATHDGSLIVDALNKRAHKPSETRKSKKRTVTVSTKVLPSKRKFCVNNSTNEDNLEQFGYNDPGTSFAELKVNQELDKKSTYNLAHNTVLHVYSGDITNVRTDVIVNAANADLAHGGGVAKAISEKAGRILQEECRKILSGGSNQLSVGCVISTSGGLLNCKEVFHAVGPIWKDLKGKNQTNVCKDILKKLIFTILSMIESRRHKTVALPAISSGKHRLL